MNKSQRIYFNINDPTNNDKFIKVKLEQKVKTLEFMSLKFKTEDAYRNFNSDYGVLVGRVIANEGVGIPNAKISIFIPVDDEDKNNGEIYSVYPYETPRDLNNEGKRYNLLPRVSELDKIKKVYKPKQPFGSFPIKPELVVNELLFDVYEKYYKYTTVTNKSGDYMIFGVPTGTQTVHMSVDITDIGDFSMTPAAMVTNLGYSPNLFTDNNTKIKPSSNLDDLPHIETQEINVDIIPFWGDKEIFEIGITRQDFRIKATLSTQFSIFGSVFTDGYESRWAANHEDNDFDKYGIGQLYKINPSSYGDRYNTSILSKRVGKVTEKIYYYPTNVKDGEIYGEELYKKMKLLDPSEYTIQKKDGDFVFIINCNRNKKIHDEFGKLIDVDDSYIGGIYTKFKGFVTLEITENDLEVPLKSYPDSIAKNKHTVNVFRSRIKIPQHTEGMDDMFSQFWRNTYYTFEHNKIYSIAKFNGIVYNKTKKDTFTSLRGFLTTDKINKLEESPRFTVGVITGGVTDDESYDIDFPFNGFTEMTTERAFGANWLNFSVYLPQMGYVITTGFDNLRINTAFQFIASTLSSQRTSDNNLPIAANDINTKWFLRNDLHWTDFIEVPEEHIKIFNEINKKGFDDDIDNIDDFTYYRNGTTSPSWGGTECPLNGGKEYGNPNGTADLKFYFYKGVGSSDCIKFVADVLNII